MELQFLGGFIPHEGQLRVLASRARHLLVCGGARSGKTKVGAAYFLTRLFEDVAAGKGDKVTGRGRRRRPRLTYWVAAPTYQLLEEPRRAIFEFLPEEMIESWFESEQTLWLRGIDVVIQFRSCENASSLVSQKVAAAWIDEIARVKSEAWRGGIRQRLIDLRGWAIGTTTPMGRNWVYSDWAERAMAGDPDYGLISFPTAANPIIGIDEIARAKRDMPDRYYRRDLLAEWSTAAGLILSEYDPNIHLVDAKNYHPSMFRRVVAGIDHGFTALGTVVVVGDLGDGRCVVLDEEVAAGRPVLSFGNDPDSWVNVCKRLRQKWNISQFVADPSGASQIFDYQRAGLPVIGAMNDMQLGIRKLCEAFHVVDGRPRLQIARHCKNLISEIGTWEYAVDKNSDQALELPAPSCPDHSLDSLRYSIVELTQYAPINPLTQQRQLRSVGPIG